MFRTKADVDRHVSDILLKIHNDNEKKLRGFTFARLYNQVKDFETAKKYLSGYLSVRDHHAPSHKLMAQLHEATGNFEKSLQCYKRSLEIDSNQRDIILKICELYCKFSVDHETARYWADRAEQFFPHHEVVFKLRECIISGEGEPDWQEHEKLITTELATQPYNLNLRTKLLHLYLKMERVKEAYVHATKVEKKKPFPNNKEWYYLLVDIFEAYQNESGQELDSSFYIMFLSALDHLVYLTLAEPHALPEKTSSHTSSNVDEAAAVLLQFDQNLKKAVNKDLTNGAWLYFLHHMKGQLYFHLGTLLLKRAKKEQGNWKQACQVGAALFLTGYSFKPANLLQEIWFSQMEEQQQLFTKFFQQGSLRTSFIGHTVLALCKEDKNKWLQKIKHNVCLPQVQERTFRQLFSCTDQKINSSESYFLNDTTFVNINLTFPILTALEEYDTAAFKLRPHSLHHLIWLQLHKDHSKDPTYRENLSEAFKGLQYSNSNLSKGNAESLCLLDLEAFLLATLYTTNLLLEQKSAVINNKNGTTALSVPPDVAEHLCSPDQGNWWKAAHSLVSCGVKMKLGEQRRILQHGLEVIRGIGNHGLEVQLVVHLARAFADQAAALSPDSAGTIKSPSEKMSSSKVSALESRAMHYWSIVLNMLEKLESNQNLPIPKDHVFVGISAALSKEEISMLREEGKLYLACRYMNSGKLESAIEVLERLMSPYASYYLALTYKKMALQESTVAVAKTALLNKARDALFMTMDRIQSDHTHLLNRDIHLEIEDVESEIKNSGSYSNANETFESEDADDYDTADASFSTSSKNGTPASAKPQRITNHSTPRPSASFMNSRNKHSNSIRHVHVQPSPERLDAQIRSLASTQTTLISTMLEQQRSLLDFNKAIIEQLKTNTDVVIQLKKKLEELHISNSKPYRLPHKKPPPHMAGGQGDEEASGVEDEEDYDPNGFLDYYVDESLEEYNRQAGYGYPHSGRAVGDTTGSSMGYVPPPALPPAHYAYQYPPPPPDPGLCPPGTIPTEAPHYYHTPINHGLPFSEGQPLPQFKFHVASPVVKPAVMSVVPQPILQNMPQQPTVPSQTSQPSMSWAKPSLVPHAFQIPLPADIAPPPPTTSQAPMMSTPLTIVPPQPPPPTGLTTTPSSSSQAKNTESPILLKALLQGSPTSTVHGVTPVASTETFSFKTAITSPDTPQLYRSRKDSEACSDTDVEREVMGDFKPAIPLPAEIIVETGEEDEIVLFEDRAKLFRFVDREWKERGIGLVKILKHKDTGNTRLLMRRDQVLKICANHLLVPNMAIQYLNGSDKSLTWTAQDFADETVKVELFCIRLKTPEIAAAFKKVFEDSLEFVKSNENANRSSDIAPIINGIIDDAVELTKPGFGAEFLPKPGSWFCVSCCLNNAATRMSCAACETPKPGMSKTVEPSSLTKSPFSLPSSLPVISPAPSSTISNIATSKPISFPTPVIASTEGLASKLIPVASQQTTIAPPAVNFSEKAVFGNLSFSTSNVFTKLGGAPSDQNQNEIEVSKSDFRTPESKPLFGGITASLGTSFETAKSGDATKTGSTIPFAGFTFSSAPVFVERPEESQDREILVVTTKSKEGPQVVKVDSSSKSSPFAGFSFKGNLSKPAESKSESIFKPSTEASSTSFSPASHSILSPAKTDPPQKFSGMIGTPCVVTVTKDGRRVSTENADATPEEFVPTAEFKPVIPLPALVNTKTGEEGEEKLFGERAKLFRYDTETKEWKERGTGELKILRNDDKYRVLMRRDQVLKICANHYILPGMKSSIHPTSDKSWVWCAQDFADGDLKQEKFAARFKTVEIALEFHKVFEKCRESVEEKTSDKSSNTNANVKSETKVSDPCLGNKNNFSNMFKPDPKSWECSACYARNIDTDCCVSCQSKKPTVLTAPKKEIGFWECQTCKIKNARSEMVCSSCKSPRGNSVTLARDSGDAVKPLSELFKPDPSSWVCDACYVRNDGTKISCSACQTTKPGAAPAQKSSTTTSSSNAFKFGVPSASTETTSSIFGSDPSKNNTSGFVFGTKTDTNSLPTFKFGASSITPSTGFVPSFGATKPSDGKAVFGDTSFTATPSSSTTSSLGLGSFNSLFQNPPDLSIAPVTAAPTFVFGKHNNTVSQTPSSTILTSSSKEPKQSASSFTFGSVNELVNKEKEEEDDEEEENDDPYEFQFGSPQKYEFNFSGVRPRSPSKSLKSPKSPGSPSDVEDDDEVEPSDVDNIYFQPVIPLPPKVEVVTGEENETPLFTSRAKLFRFTEGEWKERGIGDLKILHSASLKKTRLLMRRDQVLKVCLNHYLKKDMEFAWKGDKSLTWTAMDFSENEPCPEQFAIRFKTVELAQQFHNIVSSTVKDLPSTEGDVVPTTSSSVPTSESTPSAIGTQSFAQKLSAFSFILENESPKSTFGLSSRFGTTSPGKAHPPGATSTSPAVDFKSSFNTSVQDSDDIEFVYELKATPEQVAKALALKLPPNFYTYENKAPCPGCLGCEDILPSKQHSNKTEMKENEVNVKHIQPPVSNEALSLFSNSTLSTFSFADLHNEKTGFEALVGGSSSAASFPGAGQRLFENSTANDENEDGDVAENPDIHFEPIIPLPSLVDVKTGEEDEIPIFCYRAKVYRYDKASSQWKERGTGDMKILQHREKCSFRLLHRRELVHKVSCNHFITENLELKPMITSNNSVCWYAIDYSESQPEYSQFAVKFKSENILNEFKSKFEECKARLAAFKNAHVNDSQTGHSSLPQIEEVQEPVCTTITEVTDDPSAPLDISTSNPIVEFGHPLTSVSVTGEPSIGDLGLYYSDEVLGAVGMSDPNYQALQYSDEEDDEDIMFNKRVTFEVMNEGAKEFENIGTGSLQVLYDDSVYGYRIQFTDDNDEIMSDHIIAIQTCLRIENNFGIWAAIDMKLDPPRRRQFRARFSSKQALEDFVLVFEEGKQSAVEAEIVENCENFLTSPVAE